MKKYSLFILLLTLLAICSVSFADTVQIGTGTGTTSYLPIYGLYGYNYTQQIYTQAQINKAGNIIKLRFFYVSGTITNNKDWVIYMGHTTKTTFSSTTDWEPLANLTQVFAGDVSSYVPLANNWMEIPLTTPFNYNNTDNLIIAVDENTSGYASMSWGAFTSGDNTGIYYRSDSVNPDPASPPAAYSRTNSIDRIQLVFPNSSAPLAPTLLSPVNGGWAFTDQVLSWTPTSGAGDATGYDVYFGTSSNPPLVSSNQTATSYTPTLTAGTTYYWKVVAKNEIGDSPASAIWSFKTPTTTQLAESFENTTFPPAGWANPGSWSSSTSYAKHGTKSAYKYGSTSSQYILSTPKVTITGTSTLDLWTLCSAITGTLQVVYSPDRTTWTQIGSNITHAATNTWYNTVVDLSSLAGNNYYLGIRTGLQSASFYIDLVIGPDITPEAPGAPTLVSPADGAIPVSTLPTFTWTAPTTGGIPNGYKLYCDTNNPPTTQIADVTSLSYTATIPLLNGTQYYWTVKAYNNAGETAATPFTFTTVEQGFVIIGTGTSTQRQPFGIYFGYERSVALYTNSQVGNYGLVDRIAWNCATTSTNAAPYNIYAMQTNDTALTAMTWSDFVANATLVDTGTYTFNTTGWHLFELDTPFNYCAGNLVIAVETNYGGSGTSPYPYFYYTSGATGCHQYWVQDSTPPTGNGTLNTSLPNVMLHLSEPPQNPAINVSPASWDFGQVQINTTITKNFTISNIGGGTLSVSSIIIAGDYYTLPTNPAPVDLTAGQTAIFTVQYAPTATGTHNGTVTITDNRGTTIVDLSAVCYNPTITSAQLPYSNGFEDTWTGTPPAPVLGWTVINANNDSYTWRRGPTYITAHTGSYIAQGMGNTDDWLITPPIQASVDLRIKWWDAVESATYPNTYTVLVSTTDNSIASFTNNLGTFTCSSTTWTEHTLNLNAFTGNTIYVAFHQTASGSTYYDFGIDDFLLEAIPAAPIFSYSPTSIAFGTTFVNTPTAYQNVTVTNTGAGIINLAVADVNIIGTDAAMFNVNTANLPAALGTGQSVTIPVRYNPTAIGNHTATLRMVYNATNYDVALSGNALGENALYESFEGATFPPAGWATATTPWEIYTYYAHTGTKSVKSGYTSGTWWLMTPTLAIEDGANTLTFWYRDYSESSSWDYPDEYTYVMLSTTGNAPENFNTILWTGDYLTFTTTWQMASIDLSAYNGQNVVIAFKSVHTGGNYRIIDDVAGPNIYVPSGPPDPVTLTYPVNGATGLPKTGFNLTWTPATTGGVPNYYAVYMTQDETLIYDDYRWETNNTYFNPVTEGGITFNYLDRWYWTVEAINDDGSAVVEPPYSFEIRQAPIAISTFPWTENFDASLNLPTDWTMVDVDGAGTYWQASTAYSHSSPNSFVHSYSIAVDDGQNGWLITPAIQVPATGHYVLSWWNYNAYPSWMVYNGLLVNTTDDPNDPNWVELWAPTTVAAAWSNAVVNITPYAGQIVYFAFNYQGYDADNWYIDDVSIYELLVDEYPPVITHLPILNTPRTDINYLVYAEIADDPSWNNPIGGASVYYSTNSGTTWNGPIAMTPGTAPAYTAYIPAQPLGTTVQYYIQAWDSLNNMATTDTYSFAVNNPVWIYYDTGGTIYLGYSGYIFGPTVLYENPFYGTGIPLKLLGTDGESYYATTANLHIYSYDGTNMFDLITPIPVSFAAQAYQTFDLSSYDINITTPYFLIAYEDIPAGNYFLFDDTYDYGTTFVKINGQLYTLDRAGSWCIGAYVTNGTSTIAAPVATIANVGGNPVISWNAVSGANSYQVWSASDPYSAQWTLLATTTGTTYTYTGSDSKKFFRVIAATDIPAKGVRNVNGLALGNNNQIGLTHSSIQPVNAPKAKIEKLLRK